MTRGTIIIKEGKKYIALRYNNSDSYVSGEIGRMFVEAFKAKTNKETAQLVMQYVYAVEDEFGKECWECLEHQGEAFYNKKAAGADDCFFDYAYVFDAKTCTLKIYYFGELEYTFKKSEVEYLKCLVENSDDIWFAFTYDEKKKEHKSSEVAAKKFKRYMREHLPVDYILDDIKKIKENIHYCFEFGKCSDVWDNAYCRTVEFFPFKGSMKFIFKKDRFDGEWTVSMQLPWVRMGIIWNCKTETAAMKKLIAYLDKHWASLQTGIPLAELYGEYYQRLMKFYKSNNIVTLSEEVFNDVTTAITKEFAHRAAEYDNVHFDGYRGKFNVDLANEQLREWVHRTHRHIFEVIQRKSD